jgi:hypothetical protein
VEGLDQLLPVGRVPVERGVQLHRLADLQLLRQLALLQLRAEHLAQLVLVTSRVQPGDPDGAAVRRAQPLDAFDGRGLAGTVRAQDAEDLAFFDGEADSVDGRGVAVPFDEVVDLDDCHARSVP